MLELRDVSKRYGALTAVRNISFTVRPGDVLGYLGPNGSGKSTTVKMLVGLMPPTRGHILLDGQDVQDHLLEYKAQVGYVPEEAHVYTYLTGPEYLRLTGRLRGLDEGPLERKIEQFLHIFGLDHDVHAPLAAFSKGMRQKILLSAALLHNPRIVVLDEPVSGLDLSTALVLREVVRSLAADGRMIFYSSHELETIEKISTRVDHPARRRHRRRRLRGPPARADEGAVARGRLRATGGRAGSERHGRRPARDGAAMSATTGRVPADRAAILALTPAFLRRFFDSEITGGTQDLTTSFLWLVAFLAAPLTLMPVGAMTRYRLIIITQGPDALRLLARPDRTALILLGMMAAAMISALTWNSLMLERRDGLILGTLPVRGRSVVLAKLVALAIYVFGISAAMHAASSLLYGIAAADNAPTWRQVLLEPFAHFVAAVMACSFVFLSVTAVQGLALVLAGPAWFRRIATALQVLLVAAIVAGFTAIGPVVEGVAAFNRPGHLVPPAPWLLFTPPVWFLGLEESILGGAPPVFGRLAATGIAAFCAVALTTVVSYALAYRRVMVRVVETPDETAGAWRLGAAADWIVRRLSRTPARRASAQFFVTSIGRVERLRFLLAITLGIVCAWLVPAVLAITSARAAPPTATTTFGLSYAALAVVLVGARIAVAVPADLRAAWIVPMIDAPAAVLRSGLWRVLYLSAVVPVAAGFAWLDAWLWGWRIAALHAGVMAAAGALLVELSLWHYDGLPHHRPWRPEHANLRMWWPAYLFGFLTLTRGLPHTEWALRETIAGTAGVAAPLLASALMLRIFHRRPYPRPSFEIETFVETEGVLHLGQ